MFTAIFSPVLQGVGLVLFMEAVDLAHGDVFVWVNRFNLDAVGVMDDAVEDGFGERPFGVSKLLDPFAVVVLRAEDGRCVAAALLDELGDVAHFLFVRWDEQPLVEDEEARVRVLLERPLEVAVPPRQFHVREEVRHPYEERTDVPLDGFIGERTSQIGFPFARRARDEDVTVVVDAAAAAEPLDEPPVELAPAGVVDFLQPRMGLVEVREFQEADSAVRDAAAVLGIALQKGLKPVNEQISRGEQINLYNSEAYREAFNSAVDAAILRDADSREIENLLDDWDPYCKNQDMLSWNVVEQRIQNPSPKVKKISRGTSERQQNPRVYYHQSCKHRRDSAGICGYYVPCQRAKL